jgi:hypothetical protein
MYILRVLLLSDAPEFNLARNVAHKTHEVGFQKPTPRPTILSFHLLSFGSNPTQKRLYKYLQRVLPRPKERFNV